MANNFKFTLVIDKYTEMDITIHVNEVDNDVSKCCWKGATKHQVITVIDNDRRKRFSFDYYEADENSALYLRKILMN